MTERGVITFSVPAYDLLGSPEAVKLLYDEAERIVGFKPAKKADWNAYGLRPQGKATRSISAAPFCRLAGVQDTRRWPAYLEDGILCADLKQRGTSVVGNRAKSRPTTTTR